jgi:hypothetical protein
VHCLCIYSSKAIERSESLSSSRRPAAKVLDETPLLDAFAATTSLAWQPSTIKPDHKKPKLSMVRHRHRQARTLGEACPHNPFHTARHTTSRRCQVPRGAESAKRCLARTLEEDKYYEGGSLREKWLIWCSWLRSEKGLSCLAMVSL